MQIKQAKATRSRFQRLVHNRAWAKVTTEEDRDEAGPTKASDIGGHRPSDLPVSFSSPIIYCKKNFFRVFPDESTINQNL